MAAAGISPVGKEGAIMEKGGGMDRDRGTDVASGIHTTGGGTGKE